MELIPEMEHLIHLIARAFARTAGSENPDIYADTVVAHARLLADVPAEDPTQKTTEQLANPAPMSVDPAPADVVAVQTQNEHQDALPDSAKTEEQLAAEQQTVDAQRSDAENDHDQTIQQEHGEQSAQDAADERAEMDANAEQHKSAE